MKPWLWKKKKSELDLISLYVGMVCMYAGRHAGRLHYQAVSEKNKIKLQ